MITVQQKEWELSVITAIAKIVTYAEERMKIQKD